MGSIQYYAVRSWKKKRKTNLKINPFLTISNFNRWKSNTKKPQAWAQWLVMIKLHFSPCSPSIAKFPMIGKRKFKSFQWWYRPGISSSRGHQGKDQGNEGYGLPVIPDLSNWSGKFWCTNTLTEVSVEVYRSHFNLRKIENVDQSQCF